MNQLSINYSWIIHTICDSNATPCLSVHQRRVYLGYKLLSLFFVHIYFYIYEIYINIYCLYQFFLYQLLCYIYIYTSPFRSIPYSSLLFSPHKISELSCKLTSGWVSLPLSLGGLSDPFLVEIVGQHPELTDSGRSTRLTSSRPFPSHHPYYTRHIGPYLGNPRTFGTISQTKRKSILPFRALKELQKFSRDTVVSTIPPPSLLRIPLSLSPPLFTILRFV